MRGLDDRTGSLFSYVDLEARVRRDHPLRPIREIVNAALAALDGDFAELYAAGFGRPSIAPECGCFGRCCCRLSTASARSVS
jgi:hypothetical protein